MSELQHYGVKGMKWGVRRERSSEPVRATPVKVKRNEPGKRVQVKGGENYRPHADAIRAKKIQQQGRKSTTDSLSNKQLNDAIKRMQLEQQYSSMVQKSSVTAKGQKWLADLLWQQGDQIAKQKVRDYVLS